MRLTRTLLIALSFTLLATALVAQDAIFGTVYQTANVRSGPDTRFEIVGQLSEGDRVQIAERDAAGRWLHVILPDGSQGWLPVFALILDGSLDDVPVIQDDQGTPASETDVSVSSYGRVNVRSGPGIGYEIVGQLDVNDHADALARSSDASDWLLVRYDNVEGWVAYFTVNVLGDPRTLPILLPDNAGQSLVPPSRLLRARFNVRLHDTPELNTPVTLIVPFDSEVTVIGRDAGGDWLYIGFGEATGWGVVQLFGISAEAVQDLPVISGAAPNPVPTAEATAESD